MFFRCTILLLSLNSSILFAQKIPDTIVVFKNLKAINCSPDSVQAVALKRKGFVSFPKELKTFTNLQYLDLTGNKIDKIPSWVDELDKLKYLKLTGNRFHRIDTLLTGLPLKYLDFGNNHLDSVPDYIDRFEDLEYLILWSNDLVYFSERLNTLKQLKKLDLKGMSISYEIQDPIKESLPDTKVYFDFPCNCHD